MNCSMPNVHPHCTDPKYRKLFTQTLHVSPQGVKLLQFVIFWTKFVEVTVELQAPCPRPIEWVIQNFINFITDINFSR